MSLENSLDDYLLIRDRIINDWPTFIKEINGGQFSFNGIGISGILHNYARQNPDNLVKLILLSKEISNQSNEEAYFTASITIIEECSMILQRSLFDNKLEIQEQIEEARISISLNKEIADITSLENQGNFLEVKRRLLELKKNYPHLKTEIEESIKEINKNLVEQKDFRSRGLAFIGGILVIVLLVGYYVSSTSRSGNTNSMETIIPELNPKSLNLSMTRWCLTEFNELQAISAKIIAENNRSEKLLRIYRSSVDNYTKRCPTSLITEQNKEIINSQINPQEIQRRANSRYINWTVVTQE